MPTKRCIPRLIRIKTLQDKGKKKTSKESSEKQLFVHKGLQYDQEIIVRNGSLCSQADDIIEGRNPANQESPSSETSF